MSSAVSTTGKQQRKRPTEQISAASTAASTAAPLVAVPVEAPPPVERPDFRATESFEDFKIRILNLAINAGDCYKDLTPSFSVSIGGIATEDGAGAAEEYGEDESVAPSDAASTATGAAAAVPRERKPPKKALKATQKKAIFDELLVVMFDLYQEVATVTDHSHVDWEKKDEFKKKVITFFYKNGFDTDPINDTNNVTTAIKNFIEENYFQCPKGRKFKYNLHMSETDKQKIPAVGRMV